MLIIDVHTHFYPPSYLTLLRSRTTVPYIHEPRSGGPARLVILPSDAAAPDQDARGRPVDSSYSDIGVKLAFMRLHGLDSAILSLANPWLDFVAATNGPAGAGIKGENSQEAWAQKVNDEMEEICAVSNRMADEAKAGNGDSVNGKRSTKEPRLYAFGTLPMQDPSAAAAELTRLSDRKALPHIRGAIIGTAGRGRGLDDPALDPVWAAAETTGMLLFVHPHYGLPESVFGGEGTSYPGIDDIGDSAVGDYPPPSGHVLPLALGFPLETTIALSRMYLARCFDRYPNLHLLLAHSGGALPFLAGRLASCVTHERVYRQNGAGGDVEGPHRSIWEVLKSNLWLDAVVYSDVGLSAAASGVGSWERVLFGTDHPFFPPLGNGAKGGDEVEGEWPSVVANKKAIDKVFGAGSEAAKGILGGNAIQLFGLEDLSV